MRRSASWLAIITLLPTVALGRSVDERRLHRQHHHDGAPSIPSDYRLGAFRLPPPVGRYGVGTRALIVPIAGEAPLRVIAWYPTLSRTGTREPYLTDREQAVQAPAIARNFRWPAKLLANVADQPTNALADAPVAAGRFPLVVFNHGYWSYPRQNSALMETLAANGYIALSLAHPGDAADLADTDGVTATTPYDKGAGPDPKALDAFWKGPDHHRRVAALPGFWHALDGGRLMASLARWRRDTIALVNVVTAPRPPDTLSRIADAVDATRIAYTGMSFGGSTAASACAIDRRCRAAVNLDGFEFDRQLYDRRFRAPLLLLQSDWREYPNEGPTHARFTGYDYAYEPWRDAGAARDVYRFRLAGARHMGMTDLVLAPRDPSRDAMVGTVEGPSALAATNALVLAFLDRYLAARPTNIDAVAVHYPILSRHRASLISRWQRERRR